MQALQPLSSLHCTIVENTSNVFQSRFVSKKFEGEILIFLRRVNVIMVQVIAAMANFDGNLFKSQIKRTVVFDSQLVDIWK